MPGYVLKKLSGIDGRIVIPLNGAVVGTTSKWSLTRRTDGPSGMRGYRLSAVLSYCNDYLFHHPQLTKQFIVAIRDKNRSVNREFRVEPLPDQELVLNGMILTSEGVTLVPIEEPASRAG